MKLQLATVTVNDEMLGWWRIKPNDLQRGGIGIRLPDYRPMGGRISHIALTILLLRRK